MNNRGCLKTKGVQKNRVITVYATHKSLDEECPLVRQAVRLEVIEERGTEAGGRQVGQTEVKVQQLVRLLHQRSHHGR